MPNVERMISVTAELLLKAKNILFITGAGISADSGLPTYRGIGGLYEERLTEEGMPIESALSGAVFRSNPEVTWKYLWQIGSACDGAQPNAAHHVIRMIQTIKPDCWVLTQNVDGLHRTAGTQNLIEVHGHAFDLYCTACGFSADARNFQEVYTAKPPAIPRCPDCDGVMRPDVVLFGELLPDAAVEKMNWLRQRHNDLVLSVGTSASFPYIIEPVLRAHQQGNQTVEINPHVTEISDLYTFHIRMGAAAALQKIWEKIQEMH